MAYIGTSPSNGVRRVHTYTATANQTTFTGSSTEGVALTYADTNYIDVFQNGVLLGSADYTSTSGTSVVLAQGASVSDLVVIVVYDVFSVADTVSKTSGGTFDGGVTVSGAFTSQGIDDNADATAITIDSSERVGIGMTSPTAKLSLPAQASGDSGVARFAIESAVDSNDFTIAQYEDTNGTYTQIGQNVSLNSGGNTIVLDSGHKTASIILDGRSNGAILFQTGANNASGENYRIEHSGNHRWQHSSGDPSSFSSSAIGFQLTTSGQTVFATTGNTGYVNRTNYSSGTIYYNIFMVNGSSTVGSITYNGSATAFNTSSDYRLKESVTYDFDATSRLKQLKPSRFNFIGKSETVDGFLAHEVSSIVPEAITGEKDGVEDVGTVQTSDGTVVHTDIPEDKFPLEENQTWTKTGTQPVYQQIDQAKLVSLLVKTIQELEARITALESA